MTYEEIVRFAGTWGLLYMMVVFAVAVAYALWPKNRDKFERARRLPLQESDDPERSDI